LLDHPFLLNLLQRRDSDAFGINLGEIGGLGKMARIIRLRCASIAVVTSASWTRKFRSASCQ